MNIAHWNRPTIINNCLLTLQLATMSDLLEQEAALTSTELRLALFNVDRGETHARGT